jgi:hypothetical protein
MAAVFAIPCGLIILPEASLSRHKRSLNIPEVSQFPAGNAVYRSDLDLGAIRTAAIVEQPLEWTWRHLSFASWDTPVVGHIQSGSEGHHGTRRSQHRHRVR